MVVASGFFLVYTKGRANWEAQIVVSGASLATGIELMLVTSGGWNGHLYAYLEHGTCGVISGLLLRKRRRETV